MDDLRPAPASVFEEEVRKRRVVAAVGWLTLSLAVQVVLLHRGRQWRPLLDTAVAAPICSPPSWHPRRVEAGRSRRSVVR